MADKKKAILLRIPPALSVDLARWARDDLRSLNAQIEYILRKAVRRRTGHEPPPSDEETGPELGPETEGTSRAEAATRAPAGFFPRPLTAYSEGERRSAGAL